MTPTLTTTDQRLTADEALTDPDWCGTVRIPADRPAIASLLATWTALPVAVFGGYTLGGTGGLAAGIAAWLVLMIAVGRCQAPRPPHGLSAVALPLCLPSDGPGPWLTMAGLAAGAWTAGRIHTAMRARRDTSQG